MSNIYYFILWYILGISGTCWLTYLDYVKGHDIKISDIFAIIIFSTFGIVPVIWATFNCIKVIGGNVLIKGKGK